MTEHFYSVAPNATSSDPWLQRIGTCGSILALAILGASMLLRLTTVFAINGHAISMLPPAVEQAARLLHRLSATGVALLALCAVVLVWPRRRSAAHLAQATVWIVASTLILAVIGPLTTGYRVGAITVANVTCGMVLLMAFWWLREFVATASTAGKPMDAFSWATVVAFVFHVGAGAAASAWEMRGTRWPTFVHLGSLVLCIVLIGSMLLASRGDAILTPWSTALTSLMAAQLVLGYVMMWQDPHPFWLSFMHGMLSPLLALTLVSLAVRGSTRPGP